MVSSRAITAIAGLAGSLVVSAVAWVYFDTALLFLAVPFVPFLLGGRRRPATRRCPDCGFTTRSEDHRYCPRDGTPLERE